MEALTTSAHIDMSSVGFNDIGDTLKWIDTIPTQSGNQWWSLTLNLSSSSETSEIKSVIALVRASCGL